MKKKVVKMGMASFRLLHTINDYIATTLGFCCTAFMIYLIRRSRNTELKKYNSIMLQSTFIDLGLNTMNFLAKPVSVLVVLDSSFFEIL